MPGFQQRYGGGGGFRGGRGGGGGDRYNDELDPNSEQFRKLFIGGLSFETDEASLKKHFEQWGEIVDCIVMRSPESKRSRGFGFITYKDVEGINAAQKNRPHTIDNREVETKRAMPREEGNSANQQSVQKMFVGGLKDDTTEDHLRETFNEFGNIEKVELITDKATGKNKGFCFITFDDYDPVDKCVLKKRHHLNGRKVEVKKALPKDQMDQMRRSGPMGRGGGRGDFGGYGGGGYGGGGYGGGGYGGGYGGGNQGFVGGGYNQGGWNQGGGYNDYGGGYGNQGGGWSGGGGGFGQGYGGDYGAGYGGGNYGGGFNRR